ncbi:MAG: hypothetical protein Q9174_005088, partial [Haloplaca sp. 1 TL-2023]
GGPGGGQGRGRYVDEFDYGFENKAPIFTPQGPQGQILPTAPPSQAVETKENATVGKPGLDVALSGLSIGDELRLPSRPSHGTKGKAIVLRANYFEMLTRAGAQIYRYNIDINPKKKIVNEKTGVPNRRKIRRLLELLIADNKELQSTGIATDYGKFFIAAKRILPQGETSRTFQQQFWELEDDRPPPDTKTEPYIVKIEEDGSLSIDTLTEYLASPPSPSSVGFDKAEFLQALNIILTRTAQENPRIYGSSIRNKFYSYPPNFQDLNQAGCTNLGGGLVALKGFYTSVRTSTARILVNIGVANAAFYPAMNLLGLMRLHTPHSANDANSGLEGFITRLKVSHNYITSKKDPNRTVKRVKTVQGFSHPRPQYKINDPPLGNARTLKFYCEDKDLQVKGNITVEQFFKKKWNVTIQRWQEPCINVGTKEKPSYVPPELLTVEPGQQYNKKLNESQTTAMLDFAVRRPAENARRIVEQGAAMMGLSTTNQKLLDFGVKVAPQLITVRARVLPPVQVQYRAGKVVHPRNGGWNILGLQFSTAKQLQKWTFFRFVNNEVGGAQIKEFMNYMGNSGVKFAPPQPITGVDEFLLPGRANQDANDAKIRMHIARAAENGLQMLFCIIPKDDFIYSRVKFWGDVHFGVHTVCSQLTKMIKNHSVNPDYAANVAHKFNLKLGGSNQNISTDRLPGMLRDGKTMLVGMDVTHPSPGSLKGSPSIAGVVSSIDGKYCQWPASMRAQASRQEMIDKLDVMFGERLDYWRKCNQGALPLRVIIFRDGVSEGQYHTLLEKELPQIRATCNKVYPQGRGPKISVIVCGKRHHTRFYPTKQEDADSKTGSPLNGTVVDRGVTMEKGWDFFLQAHQAIKGTARPAHYIVLLDENGMNQDNVEELTHSLCHLYGRSTRVVSLCPPAYFADLLCERGRMYLYREFNARDNVTTTSEPEFDWNRAPWLSGVHERLENSMFYI